ncbi:serine/threonine-protein kinase meng-po isoform X2 [Condylostylus longicornis]|nr:serine/threonine-protein kinase meng-po isoform X2 [Condylostylus longicornis]XP_055385706.1 serine/threonine-protein kinase meng-po isoform X2 [Condylostylus longicornis]
MKETDDNRRTSVSGGPNMQHRNSIYKKSDASKDGGVIHTIPVDMQIPCIKFSDEYDIDKTLAEGCFAKILLATHRQTGTKIVLKAVHTELTSQKEFIKEFHYSYHLSHHPNILSAYNVCFQTNEYYVFAQELAQYGDLASNVGSNGLHESACKLIAQQLSDALGFMHMKNLVHRDLKLENVLVFTPDFSRIKLCDFGTTTRKSLLVNKVRHTWTSFIPPEILEIVKNERFTCRPAADSWQFGIILYTILTGTLPWKLADWVKDTNYAAFMKYQQKKTQKLPDNFKKFSQRLIRCFRKYFDHSAEDRCKVQEIQKYMKDRWIECKIQSSKSATMISGGGAGVGGGGGGNDENCGDMDSLCVYLNQKGSRNSNEENKIKLKRLMSSYGLETTWDQNTIRKRVWEWLQTCEETFDNELEEVLIENLTAHALT